MVDTDYLDHYLTAARDDGWRHEWARLRNIVQADRYFRPRLMTRFKKRFAVSMTYLDPKHTFPTAAIPRDQDALPPDLLMHWWQQGRGRMSLPSRGFYDQLGRHSWAADNVWVPLNEEERTLAAELQAEGA